MKEKAWLFYLNSNDYYVYLILSAYRDLLKTNTKYPVACGCTKDVNSSTRNLLKTVGIEIIDLNTTQLDNCKIYKAIMNTEGYIWKWWNKAFDKLAILESNVEEQFDKIVYLDSDIQILQNIDELMDAPHMSAVANRAPKEPIQPYKHGFSVFCAGLFVWDFAANPGIGHKLIDTINGLSPTIKWHDQAILNFWYPNWGNQRELHLDPKYGLMNLSDIYDRYKNKDDIKVIHYVSRNRADWPFNKGLIQIPETWRHFKEWVKNIDENCVYFNEKYNLNLPKIYWENLRQ